MHVLDLSRRFSWLLVREGQGVKEDGPIVQNFGEKCAITIPPFQPDKLSLAPNRPIHVIQSGENMT